MDNQFKPFSEYEYFSAYKKIRNKFRKFNSLSIIIGCFEYLHKKTDDDLEELEKQPWLVLLLVKWILLDDQFTTVEKKSITPFKFNQLLQSVHDLGALTRLPSDFEHYSLFFRSTAYQQFFYQRGFSISQFSRQNILFGNLPENSIIHSNFKKLTGITIPRFFEISMMALARFLIDKNTNIPNTWFQTVLHEYTQNEISSFLKSVSKPLQMIRRSLIEHDNGKRYAQEYYEQTPFLEFPLVQTNRDIFCVYPALLFRYMEHYIYDLLRGWNAPVFMSKFGKIFENYVQNTINYTGLKYITESELKRLFKCKGKLVDFIIFDDDANIFVDAKAVEMAYQGKVSHLSDVVKDKTKSSVIKAIKQSHDVLQQIESRSFNHPYLAKRNKNYLLVITFKELYLGNGKTFYDGIAKSKIDEIYRLYKGFSKINLEDMYFLTIDEFDMFSELIKSGKIGLVEAIEIAKKRDSDPKTKKFDFMLHLRSWGNWNDYPKFLSEKSEEMFDRLKKVFSK